MTSKHYGWQKRWRVDAAARTATHDTGLQVSFDNAAHGTATNGDEWARALAPKHGAHNLPPMLERLLREAHQAFAAASTKDPSHAHR